MTGSISISTTAALAICAEFLETLGIERKPRLISDSLDDIVGRVEARREGE